MATEAKLPADLDYGNDLIKQTATPISEIPEDSEVIRTCAHKFCSTTTNPLF